jgi:hypothetical protein
LRMRWRGFCDACALSRMPTKHSRPLLTVGAFCIAACLHASAPEVTSIRRECAASTVQSNTYVRAVLLAGKFRSQRELNSMTAEDQRNALIVELAGRTKHSVAHFQELDDAALSGVGAILVFLRESRILGDEQLKAMGEGEMRGALITDMGAQSARGPQLRGLDNLGLVRVALGISP